MTWWIEGQPKHEGFAAGLTRDGRGWRELGQRDKKNIPVAMMQAACECGWRGPRRRAPKCAIWMRFLIGRLDHKAQLPMLKDWEQHMREVLGQPPDVDKPA